MSHGIIIRDRSALNRIKCVICAGHFKALDTFEWAMQKQLRKRGRSQSKHLHCGHYWLPIHYLVRVAPVVVSMTWLVAMANAPTTFFNGD